MFCWINCRLLYRQHWHGHIDCFFVSVPFSVIRRPPEQKAIKEKGVRNLASFSCDMHQCSTRATYHILYVLSGMVWIDHQIIWLTKSDLRFGYRVAIVHIYSAEASPIYEYFSSSHRACSVKFLSCVQCMRQHIVHSTKRCQPIIAIW